MSQSGPNRQFAAMQQDVRNGRLSGLSADMASTAGGALTLSMVLRAKQENLPLPGAIAPGTPMSDLTDAGDSFYTNAMVDNVLIAPNASCDVRAGLYANGHDLKDPLLSPIFGDMHGFPSTILNTGTRDLLLSNTVRQNRKKRLKRSLASSISILESSRTISAPGDKFSVGVCIKSCGRPASKLRYTSTKGWHTAAGTATVVRFAVNMGLYGITCSDSAGVASDNTRTFSTRSRYVAFHGRGQSHENAPRRDLSAGIDQRSEHGQSGTRATAGCRASGLAGVQGIQGSRHIGRQGTRPAASI
jgi:hypothetical protein